MKIQLYSKNLRQKSERLTLFFGGFACGETLGKFLSDMCFEGDFAYVFGYENFDFSKLSKILEHYSKVDVLGWSFGVWAASRFIEKFPEKTALKFALCGSPAAVHDSFGIPEKIFTQTLENFSEANKGKFYRRVCGIRGENNKSLMSKKNAEELKKELALFSANFEKQEFDLSKNFPKFDFAIAAKCDAIFPLENLRNFFGDSLRTLEGAHLNLEIFKEAFCLLKVARSNLDSSRIASGFEKAVKNYENKALVQKDMARFLAQKFLSFAPENFNGAILEIGCGTGFLTRFIDEGLESAQDLKNKARPKMILNDLSDSLCMEASKYWRGEFELLAGDVSQIALPQNLSAVVSSSSLQWVDDFKSLAKKFFTSLNPGGIFAFSTFGEENFRELSRALEASGDASWKPLKYLSEKMLREVLEWAGFEILESTSSLVKIHFSSPAEVLRHMKLTGVNSAFARFWTRKNLREFSDAYSLACGLQKSGEECAKAKIAKDAEIFLSYNPIHIVAKKIKQLGE